MRRNFGNTQVYVEGSPLKADITGIHNGTPTVPGNYQATAIKGQITLGTFSTAEDTIGFAVDGGVQNNASIDSSAVVNATGALTLGRIPTGLGCVR